jgi:hypothetical protein
VVPITRRSRPNGPNSRLPATPRVPRPAKLRALQRALLRACLSCRGVLVGLSLDNSPLRLLDSLVRRRTVSSRSPLCLVHVAIHHSARSGESGWFHNLETARWYKYCDKFPPGWTFIWERSSACSRLSRFEPAYGLEFWLLWLVSTKRIEPTWSIKH